MSAGAQKGTDAALLTSVAEQKTTGVATMAAEASLVASTKSVADHITTDAYPMTAVAAQMATFAAQMATVAENYQAKGG